MAVRSKEPTQSQSSQPKARQPKPGHRRPKTVVKTAKLSRRSARRDLTAYYVLVKKFPLVPIRDDAHLAKALAIIEGLVKRDLDEGSGAYLDVLSGLVEAYEDRMSTIPDASEAEVLRELMRANGLNQTALQEKVGIAQSTISAVLKGSRALTRDQVIQLARFFHVTPVAFLRRV